MRTRVAALLLPLACTRGPEPPPPTPPPAFIEAEPERTDPPWLHGLSVTPNDDLLVVVHAEPIELGAGKWGVHFEIELYNRGTGTYDLGGPDPMVLQVTVTRANGGGFGTGAGCGFSSSHLSKADLLEPGERYGVLLDWTKGIGPGDVLEIAIGPCGVAQPDRRPLSGELARLVARVRDDGTLEQFELRASTRTTAQ